MVSPIHSKVPFCYLLQNESQYFLRTCKDFWQSSTDHLLLCETSQSLYNNCRERTIKQSESFTRCFDMPHLLGAEY
jgi:hypothetical protein